MSSTASLDLTGMAWPVCLLTFKQKLVALKAGQRLEVLVQDPDVADHIVMIVNRSEDRVIDSRLEGERLRLCIQKGKGSDH
jgi:TusA-related sulfurtransferase